MLLIRTLLRRWALVGLAVLLLIGAGLQAGFGARVQANPGPAVTPTATVIGTNRLTLAAQIGGETRAVALDGTRLVFGQGRRFEVADISDPAHPARIGESPLLAGDVAALAVAGSRAYVAAEVAGVLVVDLSDPAAPQQIGALALPGPATALALAGSRAYVAVWGHGLGVVDLSVPEQPRLLGVVPTGVQPEAVAFADDMIYLLDSLTGLSLLRPAGTGLPQVVATIAGDRSAHGWRRRAGMPTSSGGRTAWELSMRAIRRSRSSCAGLRCRGTRVMWRWPAGMPMSPPKIAASAWLMCARPPRPPSSARTIRI